MTNQRLVQSVLVMCNLACAAGGAAANPVSQFPITIDGQFSGGVQAGQVLGEWSDLVPKVFIAPPGPNGQLQTTTLGDPLANSLLYAGLAPESPNGPVESLYLMYAFKDLTPQTFAVDKLIFEVTFPVKYQGNDHSVDVRLLGTGQPGPAFFRVEVVADNSVIVPPGIVIANGAAAAGFGASPLSASPHFLMELEVSLLIDPGFGTPGGPFPVGGLPGGVYSPAPAFWNASAINNQIDPPISAALFTIQPDGSTLIDVSSVPPAVPEPSTFVLLAVGVATLLRRAARARRC